jgi:phosphoribosylformylglycinamidine (FGAM) synthase-like amidotransferase family enzyme
MLGGSAQDEDRNVCNGLSAKHEAICRQSGAISEMMPSSMMALTTRQEGRNGWMSMIEGRCSDSIEG